MQLVRVRVQDVFLEKKNIGMKLPCRYPWRFLFYFIQCSYYPWIVSHYKTSINSLLKTIHSSTYLSTIDNFFFCGKLDAAYYLRKFIMRLLNRYPKNIPHIQKAKEALCFRNVLLMKILPQFTFMNKEDINKKCLQIRIFY